MKEKNYLTLGLVAILLLGILVTGGCVAHISRLESAPVGPGETGERGLGPTVGAELPSTDVTSGTEPLTRYPGSVMIQHVEMGLEEETGFQILYLSRDDVATVADWYKTQLQSEGWAKEMDMTTEGTTMLVYRKDPETIQVTVSPGEFTSVSILYSIEV